MKRTEIAVGAVILIGIALVFFGVVWLKGARLGEEETTVRARFLEVGQLLVGNDGHCKAVGGVGCHSQMLGSRTRRTGLQLTEWNGGSGRGACCRGTVDRHTRSDTADLKVE